MKLKSLFLASLAAIAMASCSNEVEGVDNGNVSAEKNAKMQLSIAFPQATGTRANNNTPEGETCEQTINDLTVIVISNGQSVCQFYTKEELVDGKEGTQNMTPAFEVAAETAKVYAFANYGKNTVTIDNYETLPESATYAGLTISNNVASVENNNFHMNGSTAGVVIKAGETNYAKVEISRVAAKITENSPATAYDAKNADNYINGANMKITLTDYSLVNLNKSVNSLADDATSITADNAYNFYDAIAGANTGYADLFTAMPKSKIDAAKKTSYCLANQSTATEAANTTTQIIYKAEAKFPQGMADQDGTFYVRNDKDGKATVYTLPKLKEAFSGLYGNCTEGTTIADWAKIGVTKYDKGVCYYKQEIKTNATQEAASSKILRNNLYQLTVTGIKDLGTPEIDTPDTPKLTLLEVEVVVKPWIVNNNNIEL